MSDLIDRQKAIDAISKKQGGVFEQDAEIDTAILYVYSECKAIIKHLPSVQPRKGKWRYGNGEPATIGTSYSVICSECNLWSEYCTNFCPNCGADMRGDKK